MKVAIVDYGLGNLFSISQACRHACIDSIVTSDFIKIKQSDAMILPGVGAFGDAMNYLKKSGLLDSIQDFVAKEKPFLGICLGMQLMFTESEEFGSNEGLNFIPGKIVKFPSIDIDQNKVKAPQIQWNQINKYTEEKWDNSSLKGIPEKSYMQFVHSFYAKLDSSNDVLAFTQYAGINYASAVKKDNMTGFQFHPEKSGILGIEIYKNWAKSIK